jgi:hypothetical protein
MPSQLGGELAIFGIVGEALLWPAVGGDLLAFTLAHMAGLGTLIVGQLAHREHQKRSRIAARSERAVAWAR